MRWFSKSKPVVDIRIPRDVAHWDDRTAESLDRFLAQASPRNVSHLSRVLGFVSRIEALLLDSPDGRRLGKSVLQAPRQRLSVYGAEVQRQREALMQWVESAKSQQRLQSI